MERLQSEEGPTSQKERWILLLPSTLRCHCPPNPEEGKKKSNPFPSSRTSQQYGFAGCRNAAIKPKKSAFSSHGKNLHEGHPSHSNYFSSLTCYNTPTMDIHTPPILLDLRMKKEEDSQEKHSEITPIVICPISSEEEIPELITEADKVKKESTGEFNPQ